MKTSLEIDKLHAFSESGKRAVNQDAIFPNMEIWQKTDRLFLVCDGVGGSARGEIASHLACDVLRSFFKENRDQTVDREFLQNAVLHTQEKFNGYVRENPAAEKMATTLALAYVKKDSVIIAHLGDSRVYQFRRGHLLFRTKDHTLVNKLLEEGSLSKEAAAIHPNRNQITKAIFASTSRQLKPTVRELSDIQPGDLFFLCSDGVLEGMNENGLARIITDSKTNCEEKTNRIKTACRTNSSDNYSAILFKIIDSKNNC